MPLTFEPIAVPLRLDDTGTVRVAGSRVTLDLVLGCSLGGETAEEIAADFPSLSAADVHAVVSYYLRHRPAVDAYLEKRARGGRNARRDRSGVCRPGVPQAVEGTQGADGDRAGCCD